MKRKIIKIDEGKCTGCGLCIPNCAEGALQIIDGKVRLISDLFCDGLGACIGFCPEDAISIIEREAEPYNEIKVIDSMISKGEKTIVAHLEHLLDHGEVGYYNEGIDHLRKNFNTIYNNVLNKIKKQEAPKQSCGCPSATFNTPEVVNSPKKINQWPIQLHLINPRAEYFVNSDFYLVADCVAFTLKNFHDTFLKDNYFTIACPKLDSEMDEYVNKIKILIDETKIHSLNIMIMQVPCCSGLLKLAQMAMDKSNRKIDVNYIVISVDGKVLSKNTI